jgi:plastocyanin
MRVGRWTAAAAVFLLTGAALAIAPPAHAQADPAVVDVGCSDAGFWVSSVTAQPGDVITLVGQGNPDLSVCTFDLGSVATAATASIKAGETLDITILGPGTITVTTSLTPTASPTLEVVLASGPGPADSLQQVPVPISGSCADVQDSGFGYGAAVSGGWSPSWSWWRDGGLGGAVCTRTLHYSTSIGAWTVR